MIRFIFLTFTIFSFIYTQVDGEFVKNVTAVQRTDGSKLVDITYELLRSDTFYSYDIFVVAEHVDGSEPDFYLTNCSGDVWYGVHPGLNRHIDWEFMDQGEHFEKNITCQLESDSESSNLSGDFKINVIATATAVSEIPFEMAHMNEYGSSDPPYYPYDMMIAEVTALQYVTFLNELLSTAILIEENDYVDSYWGGYIFSRTFYFEDNTTIQIYFSSGSGSGQISGPKGILPASSANMELSLNNAVWMNLYTTSEEDVVAKIQFSGAFEEADSYSFFVSPGKSDHPVVSVSYNGANAFAKYYGLRLPTLVELAAPIGSSNLQYDNAPWYGNLSFWEGMEYLDYSWQDVFCGDEQSGGNWAVGCPIYGSSETVSESSGTISINSELYNLNGQSGDGPIQICWDEQVYEEGDSTDIEYPGGCTNIGGIIGNVRELTITTNINSGPSASIWHPNLIFGIDNFIEYYEADLLAFPAVYAFGGSYQNNMWYQSILNSVNTTQDIGFRCVRSIPIDNGSFFTSPE